MIRDCRDNRPAGWSYLIATYSRVIHEFTRHYAIAAPLDTIFKGLHQPALPLYAAPGPRTEREFVTMLRQHVIAHHAPQPAPAPLDLDLLTTALEPFSATERQFLWLDALGYSSEATAKMLNLEATTVQGARDRGDEALRAHLDRWTKGLLRTHGAALSAMAFTAPTTACLPPNAFLDMIDGRLTWSKKRDYEFHLVKCWYCVDHFCRMREADFTLLAAQPLPETGLARLRQLLQVPEEKKGLLQRLFAR